jgi:hypothetical protein
MIGMIRYKKGIEPIPFMPCPHFFLGDQTVVTIFGMGVGGYQYFIRSIVYDGIIGQSNKEDNNKN